MSCNADLGFRGGETGLLADRLGNDGYRHFNISDDGSVYFETRLALVPEDQNGRHYDVYRWRAGDLSLVSPGASDDHAFFSGNSRDGSSVFFWSSQRIDPREIDEHDYDIYVARVGGGFPLPPAPPPPCQVLADACQGGGGQAVPIAPTTPAGGGSNATPGARADLRVVRPGAKERRRAARRGVVRLRVRSNTTGRIVLRARARMRLRGKAVTRPAGSARTVLRQPGARTVALRLSKTARRQLIQGRRVRLRVVARHPGARPQTVGFVLQRGGRR